MFEFFDSVIGYIETAVDFIVSFVQNIIMVIMLIVRGFESVSLVVVYMPTLLQAVTFAVIAYCVVVNLINKGG